MPAPSTTVMKNSPIPQEASPAIENHGARAVEAEDINGFVEDLESESTPLLANGKREPTPLPIVQLLILGLVRLAEPISYTQIFPYVNQMMEELEIAAPADIGYYSGLVDSMFSVAQLFTIYFWSSLSDRIGRKPVILMGLSGVAVSAASFGLSRSLTSMLISRSIAGALSGNAAVISSMIAEITDETNQGTAYPLLGVTWNLGCVLGPMIGGNLIRPAQRWPGFFSGSWLFTTYPFLLPCMVSSCLTLLSIILCSLFVKETLPSAIAAKKARKLAKALASSTSSSTYGSLTATPTPKSPSSSGASSPTVYGVSSPNRDDADAVSVSSLTIEPSSSSKLKITSVSDVVVEEMADRSRTGVFRHLLGKPHIRAVLGSAFMLSMMAVGFDVVFVLYSYTSVELGGMARSPSQIGTALAGSGMVGAVSALFIFPILQRRFNNQRMYAFFASFYTIGYALMPLGNIAARIAGDDVERRDALVWSAIVLILIPIRIALFAFPTQMILVKSSIADSSLLGAMFGLQQTFSATARAIAPAFTSTLFAASIEYQILGGYGVWVVMVLLSLVAVRNALVTSTVELPRSITVGKEAGVGKKIKNISRS